MGLFSDLIGGALGLVGAAAEAVIDAGVSAHNDKKLRQQLENNASMLEQFMNDCINCGKNSVAETRCELFKDGMNHAIDDTTESLVNNNCFKSYIDILKNNKDISEIYGFVQKNYQVLFVSNEKYADNENLKQIYATAKNELIRKIKEKIDELLIMDSGITQPFNKAINFFFIVPLLCLMEIVGEDTGYKDTIYSLHTYHKDGLSIFSYLKPLEHGDFDLEDVENSDIDKLKLVIKNAESRISHNETGYYEGLRDSLKMDFLVILGQIMWYYATKSPFDQAAFNRASSDFNKYFSVSGNSLESIVAEIYVKNRLGGEALVMQNIDEIMKEASVRNPVYARALCSFLAWIECYKIELEVLNKAVQEKIQLTPDMLERLEFLSKGGTDNKFKIYSVDSSVDTFKFDSSTEGIDANDINALFDLLKRKCQVLNYSIFLNQWTKTIPLAKGKVFSKDALNAEFKLLMEDFEGEIEYSVKNAEAINLNTISYEKSSIFRFTSERNRGITMLFNCEKFGRNINIVILTLFTPDEKMFDDASTYARAVLSNRYVESFRESILQAVDSSLKDKVEIYDSGFSTQNAFFE